MDKYGGNALETFHLMELRMSQKVDVSYNLYEGKGNYRTYVFYHGTGNGLRLLKNLEVFHSDNCQNAEAIAFRFRIITIEKRIEKDLHISTTQKIITRETLTSN